MILRMVLASARRRPRQLVLVAGSVAIAAATVAALVAFAGELRVRVAADLDAFGPNLLVRPEVGGPAVLPAATLERIAATPGVERVESGADRIAVRVAPERLEAVASALRERLAGAEVVPVRRVSEAERRLGGRVAALLAAVAVLTLALVWMAAGSAVAALVDGRRPEIGLLLALGFEPRRIAGILGVELLAAALVAACVGVVGGIVLGARLAGGVLGGGIGAGGGLALATAPVVAVVVVLLAASLPLRGIARLDPARVLAGE